MVELLIQVDNFFLYNNLLLLQLHTNILCLQMNILMVIQYGHQILDFLLMIQTRMLQELVGLEAMKKNTLSLKLIQYQH